MPIDGYSQSYEALSETASSTHKRAFLAATAFLGVFASGLGAIWLAASSVDANGPETIAASPAQSALSATTASIDPPLADRAAPASVQASADASPPAAAAQASLAPNLGPSLGSRRQETADIGRAPAIGASIPAQLGFSKNASASADTLLNTAPLSARLVRDIPSVQNQVRVTLGKGETIVDALKAAGVRAGDRHRAANALGKHENLRRLRVGQEFVLTTAVPNRTLFELEATLDQSNDTPDLHLIALEYKPDPENRVFLNREVQDFSFDKTPVAITTRHLALEGQIDGSLYVSAKALGATDKSIIELANLFAYDVDFQREIFGGDEFEAVVEMKYDDEGALVSSGDILYARLKWRGQNKEKGYYRFLAKNGGAKADYFDGAGQSAKRLLMKTPIDGARLSSGFGTRKHPILGYRKAHKGVDFAARRGTPVYAAGDGVIVRANRYGSFGNYVKIRHANGYETAYAHLNGFRKGIRKGKRVEQGDVIAYVGSTGRSTGPHLHYEVHKNGKAVNPQRLKIATGVALKGADLDKFKKIRDEIDALRVEDGQPIGEAPAVVAEDDAAATNETAL